MNIPTSALTQRKVSHSGDRKLRFLFVCFSDLITIYSYFITIIVYHYYIIIVLCIITTLFVSHNIWLECKEVPYKIQLYVLLSGVFQAWKGMSWSNFIWYKIQLYVFSCISGLKGHVSWSNITWVCTLRAGLRPWLEMKTSRPSSRFG